MVQLWSYNVQVQTRTVQLWSYNVLTLHSPELLLLKSGAQGLQVHSTLGAIEERKLIQQLIRHPQLFRQLSQHLPRSCGQRRLQTGTGKQLVYQYRSGHFAIAHNLKQGKQLVCHYWSRYFAIDRSLKRGNNPSEHAGSDTEAFCLRPVMTVTYKRCQNRPG